MYLQSNHYNKYHIVDSQYIGRWLLDYAFVKMLFVELFMSLSNLPWLWLAFNLENELGSFLTEKGHCKGRQIKIKG